MEEPTEIQTEVNPSFESRLDLSPLQDAVERVRNEIHKIIIGQDRMIDLLVAAILADGHVLIEGVPGVAKTLTAKLVARAVDVPFSRIQFTPDLMPSDITGTPVFNPEKAEFVFRRGPIFSNIVLIDEVNRAPAKTQSALFEVMEERQVTVDGVTYPMQPPFLVVATENPIEHEGTYRLPEAQLDRFLFKINVGYPSLDEETLILDGHLERGSVVDVAEIEPVLSGEDVVKFRKLVRKVHVEPHLRRYIAQVVHRTRDDAAIYLGASPRASIAIMMGARAVAAMRGRDFVTPDDVQEVAAPVLRHRIILTPEREMEGGTPELVIKSILQTIEIPR